MSDTRLIVSNIDETPEDANPPRAFMTFVNQCASKSRDLVKYGYSRAELALTSRSVRREWHFWGAYSNPTMLNGWRFSAIYRVAADNSQKAWDCTIWNQALKVYVTGCSVTDVRNLLDENGNVGIQFVHDILEAREAKKRSAPATRKTRMGAA